MLPVQKRALHSDTNQDIDVSCGGKNTKIHAVVDGLGNPVKLLFTGGNVSDCSVAVPLLSDMDISAGVALGDKAYGTNEIRSYVSGNGAEYCIPPKSNAAAPWACDYDHYKERHVVECFFRDALVDRDQCARGFVQNRESNQSIDGNCKGVSKRAREAYPFHQLDRQKC